MKREAKLLLEKACDTPLLKLVSGKIRMKGGRGG